MKQNSRRAFIKGALITSGALGAAAVFGASGKSGKQKSGGVASGKSKKNEVLYKKTQAWDEYYKNAL